MNKKLGIYLLVLMMLLGMWTPMGQVQAAETPEMNISDKMGGLEPLIAMEMPDEKANQLINQASTATYQATAQELAYWSQFSNSFYYDNYLNEAEKAFWDGLMTKAMEMATTSSYYGFFDENIYPTDNTIVYYDTSISSTRMKEIYYMFQYMNPQFYFLSNGFWFNTGSGVIWMCTYEEFADGELRTYATQQFTSKVDQWVADIKTYARDDQKVKRAHDIICLNTIYEFNDLDQTAYSMVCNGITVCAGYAKTTNLLLNATGVNSIVMLGPGHAWNAVQVHGIWYELDVTWDDYDSASTPMVYWCYNKSWSTFVENGHEKESPYNRIDLNENYDSDHYYNYINPYFTQGGNTYFIVNENTNLNPRLVKRVEGTAALPQTVTYNGRTYQVMYEASIVDDTQVRAFVERMYTVALGRAAEADGLDFYTRRLIAGDSNGACLAESFLCSPEFLNKGYDDAQYVKVLYKTFFDREPAAEEVNYWVGKLASGQTKAFVLSGFVNSVEFDNLCSEYGISRGFMREDGKPLNPGIGRFAERLYTVVLERAGEKEGIEYWSLSIANGVCTPKDAAKSFFFSQEYVNKNTSDAQYITTLYHTFMDRAPEVGGVEYWQNVLKNGATREQILDGFADSAEFKGIMASFGL